MSANPCHNKMGRGESAGKNPKTPELGRASVPYKFWVFERFRFFPRSRGFPYLIDTSNYYLSTESQKTIPITSDFKPCCNCMNSHLSHIEIVTLGSVPSPKLIGSLIIYFSL
jgi:hypothetical protein